MIALRSVCILALVGIVSARNVTQFPYEGEGPFSYSVQADRTESFPETGCRNADFCRITFTVVMPEGDGPFPIAVVHNGFTVDKGQYLSYAERLASYGYITFTWNPLESPLGFLNRRPRALMAHALVNWAEQQSSFAKMVDANNVFIVGHSVGGQGAALGAILERGMGERVKGAVALDPVDCLPPFTAPGPENPIAGPQIRTADWAKFAYVGAEFGGEPFLGQACAPRECNYTTMYDQTPQEPSWKVMVKDAGHMQFLDDRPNAGLPAQFCVVGPNSVDAIAAEIAKTVMIAWAEYTVRGVDISDEYLRAWASAKVAEGLITSETNTDRSVMSA